MNKQELKDWKNAMIKSAKLNYNESKSLMPVVMLITENNENIIIGMPFDNQEEKEKCASAIKRIVREKKAIAVVFIHEAYYVTVDKNEKNTVLNPDGTKIKPIKDVKGRKESIVVYFQTKAGERELTMIEIENQKLGKERTEKGADMQGLFSNFFETPTWLN